MVKRPIYLTDTVHPGRHYGGRSKGAMPLGIGNSDPFHFRVSTGAETYMFDLKERLKPEAYDFAWQEVFEASRLR